MFDHEKTWETTIAVILASAGGFARLLSLKDTQNLSVTRILSELFVSGFSGLMVLFVSRASGLSGDWLSIAAGMAGWIGPRVLDVVAKLFQKSTGINVDSDTSKGEK